MSFNDESFNDLLNFYKDTSNFPSNSKSTYDTYSIVSASYGDGNPLIDDNHCLFNLDNMCENSYLKKNGRIKANIPSSIDGLYFKKGKLYLIEFKGIFYSFPDYKKILKSTIKNIKLKKCESSKENCPLNENTFETFNDIQEIYEDEIFCKLKNKPLESLFIVLPHIYKRYCEYNNLKRDKNGFMNWLINVPKMLIIVFLNDDKKSERYESKTYKSMNNKLAGKYAHLKDLVNMEYLLCTQDEFKEEFINRIYINNSNH